MRKVGRSVQWMPIYLSFSHICFHTAIPISYVYFRPFLSSDLSDPNGLFYLDGPEAAQDQHGVIQLIILDLLFIFPFLYQSSHQVLLILFLFFLIFILFFNFTILYWFCHVSKWIHHRYKCVPHPEPSSLPIPSLWVVPVHQPQASSIMHRTWTGDSFHIWYYTCFNAILPNHPTFPLSHRVQKTVLYVSVSFAVSYTGLLLPSF